jgi:hypothetical protein
MIESRSTSVSAIAVTCYEPGVGCRREQGRTSRGWGSERRSALTRSCLSLGVCCQQRWLCGRRAGVQRSRPCHVAPRHTGTMQAREAGRQTRRAGADVPLVQMGRSGKTLVASGGRCMENGSKPLRDALRQCWDFWALRVTCESASSIVHVLSRIPVRAVRGRLRARWERGAEASVVGDGCRVGC